jgi:hypothetical protein
MGSRLNSELRSPRVFASKSLREPKENYDRVAHEAEEKAGSADRKRLCRVSQRITARRLIHRKPLTIDAVNAATAETPARFPPIATARQAGEG